METKYCECGCGTEIMAIDSQGRPRRFALYHQNRRGAADYIEEDRGYRTPCWVWQRAMARGKHSQYPQTTRNSKSCGAHRAYYEDRHGRIPDGMTIDHLCRVPACVNPDHLEVVTGTINTRRGTQTKLTAEQVQAVHLHAYRGVSQRQIAEMFNIGQSQVSRILSGLRWPEFKSLMEVC